MSNKFLKYVFLAMILISVSCNETKLEPTNGTPLNAVPVRAFTPAELMDKVQKESIKYFWEYANTNSKLALERVHFDNSGYDQNLVAIGGSGFGLMSILVGVHRGFYDEEDAFPRLQTALNFLQNMPRYHGAWPHWADGTSGQVRMIFAQDDGGDIVETAFLCEALICIREKYKNGNTLEVALAQQADNLWRGVEWDWYTNGQNSLTWHWSPNHGFAINNKLYGYNETMIAYVLAAASPTHPISAMVYNNGWARNGGIANGAVKYGLPVILDHAGASGSVGPMFYSHYSFLGLDPTGLSDGYVNYGTALINHAKIQHKYSVANPNHWGGYSDKIWGLTASESRNSDGSIGYHAHSIETDKGVITPTAALSDFPYSPDESMKFLKYCYEENSAKLIGPCGPYDAFSPHYDWYTKRYLAIDQGTIAPMIENYRSGLLWNWFMNAPDVRQGLINLGFHSTKYGF